MAPVFETPAELKARLDSALEENKRLAALVDKLNGNANWSRARAQLNASDWWWGTGSAIHPNPDEDYEEFASRILKLGIAAALKGL